MSAWVPLFDARTTLSECEAVIAAEPAAGLARACAQINTILSLSPAERDEAIALIAPIVAARTRDALLAGWFGVQAPARVH